MGVLGDGSSWCFCSGGGKSEKIKGGIFTGKGPAMAVVSNGGTGFLIHRSLLLTTHVNVPSAAAAEASEIQIHGGKLPARLVPQRFFITSSILDLTIVGLDVLEMESNSQLQQPHYLKTCQHPCLELGSEIYILGYSNNSELKIAEGKVSIATDNLVKLSTDGVTWPLGSAGFDLHGNLAFMVCDPMKCTSSPTTKSTSTSSSALSWKKDHHMQFGIPMPIICDWLYQHWDGSLDEISKPRLPLRRLISSGQKSDSCASFTLRSVFKPAGPEIKEASPPSQLLSKPRCHSEASCSAEDASNVGGGSLSNLHPPREQGIPTPEIYDSPKLTSGPVRARDFSGIHLLDINFPPRRPQAIVLPLPIRQLLSDSNGNIREDCSPEMQEVSSLPPKPKVVQRLANDQAISWCSDQADCISEVESSSSPMDVSGMRHEGNGGFSSEGETMYSAETMESRNYPSPKHGKLEQVRRSQSCVSYNRWGSSQRYSTQNKSIPQKHKSTIPARKTHSQTGAVSQRSHDYCSPTVSSIMKKRNNSEHRPRTRPIVIQDSPRWMF